MPDNPATRPLSPLLVDDATAAEILGIGKTLLREMVRTGELGPPPIRIRSLQRHSTESLRQWVAMGCPSRPVWLSLSKPQAKIPGQMATQGRQTAQAKDYESVQGVTP